MASIEDSEFKKFGSMYNDVKHIQREHAEARKRCDEIQKALYTLVEAQKNTTKNVDRLAEDVKVLIKNAYEFHVLEHDISDLNKRCDNLESSKQWGFRLIVGAVIMSAVGFLLNVKLHV